MTLLVLPTGIAWSIADSRRINVFEYANDQIEARLFLETFWSSDNSMGHIKRVDHDEHAGHLRSGG
jgi:hypothetical protein